MLTCGGFDVLSAHVRIPLRGPWTAEVVLDTPGTAPPASVVLSAPGGISLAGVVARGGVNPALLRWEGTLVGGGGFLSSPVIGAYQNPQLGDLLDAVAVQSGEKLSTSIAASLRALQLPAWTLGRCAAAAALDALASAARDKLSQDVYWRPLADGTIWMGTETWPAATLPASAEVVDPSPLIPYNEIACEVPALMPGVDLEDVGHVLLVEHWVEPDNIRTWAWTG